MEIIKSEEYEYVCHYYIDKTVEGHEIVNQGLDTVRNFLQEVDERTQIKNIPYRVVAYEYDQIDAFSIRQAGEYVMGVSINTFNELHTWFRMWFSNEKIYEVFDLKKEEKARYIQETYEYSLRFLLAHEYSHVKNGHCDLPQNKERFIFEQSREIERENALFAQVLENDADSCAMACCVNHILFRSGKLEEIKEKMQLQVFAVYSIFKIFSEYEEYNFDNFMEEDLLKYDHPDAGLRFIVSQCVLASILLDVFAQDNAIFLLHDLEKSIVSFEHDIFEIHDLRDTLFAIAYTEKGEGHIVQLNNSWDMVRKQLEPYAHCKLAEFEQLNNSTAFIDEKGMMLGV